MAAFLTLCRLFFAAECIYLQTNHSKKMKGLVKLKALRFCAEYKLRLLQGATRMQAMAGACESCSVTRCTGYRYLHGAGGDLVRKYARR